MTSILAWCLFALGTAHIAYGLKRFRRPLAQALAQGFVGQFGASDERRAAFWFVIFGVPMMLAGHVALHAAGSGDLALLRVIGGYLVPTALIGVAAFPRSPFWGALLLAPLLLAAGYGLF